MVTAYGVLKVVHILSAIVWLGGAAASGAMSARAARARDRAALAVLSASTTAYGVRFAAPAMGLVLLTGLTMVWIGHLGFGSLWVVWGFGGMVVHFIFGATLLRKSIEQLAQMLSSAETTDAAIFEASQRLSRLTSVYLVFFVTVVAAMVLKPTW